MAFAPVQSPTMRGSVARLNDTWTGNAGMAGLGGKLGGDIIRAAPKPAAPKTATAPPVPRAPSYDGSSGVQTGVNQQRSMPMPSMPTEPSNVMIPMWQGTAPSPTSSPDASNDQTSQALTGLQGAFKQVHGPSPGWADDGPLNETADRLAQRTPPMPTDTLVEVMRRFGRTY